MGIIFNNLRENDHYLCFQMSVVFPRIKGCSTISTSQIHYCILIQDPNHFRFLCKVWSKPTIPNTILMSLGNSPGLNISTKVMSRSCCGSRHFDPLCDVRNLECLECLPMMIKYIKSDVDYTCNAGENNCVMICQNKKYIIMNRHNMYILEIAIHMLSVFVLLFFTFFFPLQSSAYFVWVDLI